MANDGSRARARRDPNPIPIPIEPFSASPADDAPENDHSDEGGKASQPKKTASQRGTRIPEDFTVTEDMVEWARLKTPNAGLKDTEAFVDYYRAAPGQKGVKLDWVATWRNWMRKAQQDYDGQRRRSGYHNGSGYTGRNPAPESNAPKRIPPGERCLTHPNYPAHNCGPCKSEQNAAYDPSLALP